MLIRARDLDDLRAALAFTRSSERPRHRQGWVHAIARGMGRSYGDAAQLRDGLVLDTTALTRFQLDQDHGLLSVQAGITIGEVLRGIVGAGWILPVVPGTQHVSIGGAIASDIHGKNHAQAGTFSRHVRSLELLTADGELRELEPADELFQATVGGMGLTGVIVSAKIALRAIASPLLSVDIERVESLDAAFAALQAPGGVHRVAWLDLLGTRAPRGIVTRAEHLEHPLEAARGGQIATVRSRMTVPARWPSGLLRASTVAFYNELRFRRAPRREHGRPEPFGKHMFPLDALGAWPRLYGRDGLIQYQLVVPRGAEPVIEQVIVQLRHAHVPCYLAVLKDFGPAGTAPLSFPMQGWTLALDLPRVARGLSGVLDSCDQLVAAAGGRVYLAKDVRLRPELLKAMYPRLAEWQALRERADPDRRWCSDLGLRTGLLTVS